jgi:hypothetical protein
LSKKRERETETERGASVVETPCLRDEHMREST